MNRTTFSDGMALLSATWPDRSPTAQTTAAYWLALAHLGDSTYSAAVERCLRECRFFPAPAEILERAEAALTAAGLLPVEPEQAWRMVLTAARHWSPTAAPSDWTPDIDRTLRELGGMRAVALSDDDEITWVRKAFIERYSAYRRRRLAADLSLMGQALSASSETLAPMLANGRGSA